MAAPKAEDRDPARLCQANRSNGRGPCSSYAVAGQVVCRVHGGAAPQAINKARQRLELAADRLAHELLGIAIDPEADPNTKLKAIGMALDRAGITTKQTIAIGPDADAPWLKVLDGLVDVARTTRDGRPLPPDPALQGPPKAILPNVIEGEVVESPYTPEDYDHVPTPPLASGNAAAPAEQQAALQPPVGQQTPVAPAAPKPAPNLPQRTGLVSLEQALERQAQQPPRR